jgi:hypothetical protein
MRVLSSDSAHHTHYLVVLEICVWFNNAKLTASGREGRDSAATYQERGERRERDGAYPDLHADGG